MFTIGYLEFNIQRLNIGIFWLEVKIQCLVFFKTGRKQMSQLDLFRQTIQEIRPTVQLILPTVQYEGDFPIFDRTLVKSKG
jgi:hypothetical protein